MVKVSVIVPVYNGEKYLTQCLDSIINQTLEDIEIICINDGSEDNSLSILERYASMDNRIKIISTENRGLGAARNSGLELATGEYVAFVDADDWIDKETYEQLYSKSASSDLDLNIFQLINYMENNDNLVETDLYNHKCFINHNISEKSIFNHEDTKEYLFEIPVCAVSKLYKKEFLDKNTLHFPEGFLFEDNSFFYNAYFKAEKCGFLAKHLYFRRRHEESITQKFDKDKFDVVKAANEILNVFIENNTYETYKPYVINHTFSMLLEWFSKLPLKLKNDFFKFIKANFRGFHDLIDDFRSNLNEKYLNIFNISSKHNNYVDYYSEYKLNTTNYIIYDCGNEYELNSEKYYGYKSDNKSYKITVIIPIYNNETIIKRTLRSIEKQSFGIDNIEVLMINDCSTDNTFNVINEYADKYESFKAIHIQKGTGSPGTPRNIGIKEASAEYVIFLDHDDFFNINALETLYNTIISKNIDIVYGTYVSIDNQVPTKIIYPKEHKGYFENIDANPRAIAFPPPSIWTKLFKKDLLLENDILFPTIFGEDAIFLSKALVKASGIEYLGDALICYHDLNDKSNTNNVTVKYLEECFVAEKYMYDMYNNVGKEEFYKIRGEGILDFYLKQFYLSNLNILEVNEIFTSLYEFTKMCNNLGLTPHVTEINKILFKHILEKDIDSILIIKGLKEDSKQKNNFELKLKNFPGKTKKLSRRGLQKVKRTIKNKINPTIIHEKTILYVIHSGVTGGTFLTNKDLMKNVEKDYNVYLLAAEDKVFKLYSFSNNNLKIVKTYRRYPKLNVESDEDREYELNKWSCKEFHNIWLSYIYFDILVNYNVNIIHIRHLINHSFDIVEVAKQLNIPVVLSMHDFYFICPFFTLLDENNNYCEGKCVKNSKNCYVPMSSLEDIEVCKDFIPTWQKNVLKMFSNVEYFVTTSEIVKKLFLSIYTDRTIINEDNYKVIEHGRDFPKLKGEFTEIPSLNKPIKILCPANHLNVMKGSEIIKTIKKEDKNNSIEFHFLGKPYDNLENYGISHGTYERDEFYKKVKEIKPSFIGIFSIWPETFCNTITEGWACGVPIIGTNIGVIKDRIMKNNGGWVIDKNNPQEIYKLLYSLSENTDSYLTCKEAILNINFKSTYEMSQEYIYLYNILDK